MKKTLSFFIILFFLVIITFFVNPLTSDFGASIVPGWHTTIYPRYYSTTVLLISLILLDFFIYRKFIIHNQFNSKAIIIIHFIVSCILMLLIRHPLLFIDDFTANPSSKEVVNFMTRFVYLNTTFFALQLIYLLYILVIFIIRSKTFSNEKPKNRNH